MMAGRWNDANNDVLEEIAERLLHSHSYWDYVRLRSVCRSWRSILPKTPTKLPCGFPCLVLPREDTHSDFFSIFVGETYKLEIPDARIHVCKGSSHGWLITVSESLSIHLTNPLTNTHMQLPPINTFEDVLEFNPSRVGGEYLVADRLANGSGNDLRRNSRWMHRKFIQKVVLSSSPMETNCTAMAIYGGFRKLAYCRLGDNKWSSVRLSHITGARVPWLRDTGLISLKDIVQYNGKFYVVGHRGMVYVVDMNSWFAEATLLADLSIKPREEQKLYVAVSNGDLLIINQYRYMLTTTFEVFRCDVCSGINSRRLMVESLGDKLLFLGQNESFCVSARDVPCPPKCNSAYWNAIYFTDGDGGSGYGVFQLDDDSLQTFPHEQSPTWATPIWITPNLSNQSAKRKRKRKRRA